MTFTIRPYRSFLPLVYCSGVWTLITLLWLSAEPVYAEWVEIVQSASGTTIYLDTEYFRRKDDTVKVWQLHDYNEVRGTGTDLYLSLKVQKEYDCSEGRTRALAMSAFSKNMGRGDVVFTKKYTEKWEAIEPDSVGQTLLKLACAKK